MASPSCSLCAVLVPRTDRRVLRSRATSSVFSVLSDLTVQLLIHCICGAVTFTSSVFAWYGRRVRIHSTYTGGVGQG